MTHDELLTKLNPVITVANITKQYQDLRAVVELHKPQIFTVNDGYKWFYCTICTDGFAPCTTIQAIEKEITYHD